MSPYQVKIADTLFRLNYNGVTAAVAEAWMRLEHGTLDHLGGRRWVEEVRIAAECAIAATNEQNSRLAESYGL